MARRFEYAENKAGTKLVLQHVSEYQVSVFSQHFLNLADSFMYNGHCYFCVRVQIVKPFSKEKEKKKSF